MERPKNDEILNAKKKKKKKKKKNFRDQKVSVGTTSYIIS